jgi:hypothetical protein
MSTYKIVGGDRREYGPVDEQQIRQWISQGRVNGETLAQAEGGVWKKLSQFPEFADAFSATPPPALPPPAVAEQVAGSLPGLSDPKSVVTAPAVALLIVAIMDLSMALLGLLAGVAGWGFGTAGAGMQFHAQGIDPDFEQFIHWITGPIGIAGNLVSLVINALILVGALRMMSLRNYGLCMVAAVLAVIPCTAPCCCLGIAAGIWALVILTRPEVKQAFS